MILNSRSQYYSIIHIQYNTLLSCSLFALIEVRTIQFFFFYFVAQILIFFILPIHWLLLYIGEFILFSVKTINSFRREWNEKKIKKKTRNNMRRRWKLLRGPRPQRGTIEIGVNLCLCGVLAFKATAVRHKSFINRS